MQIDNFKLIQALKERTKEVVRIFVSRDKETVLTNPLGSQMSDDFVPVKNENLLKGGDMIKTGDKVYNKHWLNKEQCIVLQVDDKGVTLESFINHSDYCGCNKGAYIERNEVNYSFERYSLETWVVNEHA